MRVSVDVEILQVDRMLDTAVGGVDFWALNTDAQVR